MRDHRGCALAKEVKTVVYYTVGHEAKDDIVEEPIYTSEDDEKEQAVYQHRKLVEAHGSNIVKYIERLYRNLGHPRPNVLVQMPEAASGRAGHCLRKRVHVQDLSCTTETNSASKGIAAQGDQVQRQRADGLLQGCAQDRQCHGGT